MIIIYNFHLAQLLLERAIYITGGILALALAMGVLITSLVCYYGKKYRNSRILTRNRILVDESILRYITSRVYDRKEGEYLSFTMGLCYNTLQGS